MTPSALVLSGGESSRFGGAPKALLPTDGRSAVRRIAEICLDHGLAPVAVVVGPHRGPIEHELRGLAVDFVVAESGLEGRTAAVQAGLEALPEREDVLFWPVDHPFVAEGTLETLLDAPRSDLLGVWFIPTYRGEAGHPVYWRAALRPDLLDLRPDAPIRSLLPEFGPQVVRVPVDDPGIVVHADTPELYRAALEGWPGRETRGGTGL